MAVHSVRKEDTERHHIFTTAYPRAGDECELHAHARWHLMLCRKGTLRVELWPHNKPELKQTMYVGCLDQVEVPAGWWHKVTALEDECFTSCIFDLYDEEGRKLDDPKAGFLPGTVIAS